MKLDASDIPDLRPVIVEVVRAVLAEIEAGKHRLNGEQLGYSEGEAAELLDVKRHVLRDARLRGEVRARKLGKEFRYEKNELLRFLRETK